MAHRLLHHSTLGLRAIKNQEVEGWRHRVRGIWFGAQD